jgi:murein L,D-transpeptidase YafK
MMKVGYDNFEVTKVPPKVYECEKRYVFNQVAADGQGFNPTGACPATTQPDSLKMAYSAYQSTYEAAFNSAVNSSTPEPKPTIAGIKEANLVSEWTRKRARGERVTLEPPSLTTDGAVVETTTRMGRIDSPAGRKMAALDAEKAAKKKAAEEKAAAAAAEKAAKELAKQQLAAEKAAAKAAKEQPAAVVQAPAEAQPAPEMQTAQSDGTVSKLKKRLLGMFGG